MTVKDYTSVYNIKDFAMKEIAPKYFNLDEISHLNVGLFGYINDVMSNNIEDVFNTVSTYSQEIFPNRAMIPDNIYSYAAYYEIDNILANASEMDTILVVKESDVHQFGEKDKDKINFIIDSNLNIDIEGINFSMDYDIHISCKPQEGKYLYSCKYIMGFKNGLSSIINPYITTRSIVYNNAKYLALYIRVRQVTRAIQNITISDNDTINVPTVSFNYNGNLANFEVFYKETPSSQPIQLRKRLSSSTPITDPFCFYKVKSENEIELTFSPKESYFQPTFNSEIIVYVYESKGEEGNFPLYRGNNITVIPSSEKYVYNNNMVMFAIPQSDAMGGTSSLSFEALKDIVHQKRSTLGVFNTESDLQLYFNTMKHRYGTDIKFIKKRDDIYERLFSSFVLLKDKEGNYFNTNTTNLRLSEDEFDIIYDQTDRYMLKAGKLLTYSKKNKYETIITSGGLGDFGIENRPEEYIYTTPFLIMLSGNVVGFYLNSLRQKYVLDYSYVNEQSFSQFICNSVSVERNAALGGNDYIVSIYISPASPLDREIITSTGEFTDVLKVKGTLNDYGSEVGMFDFEYVRYEAETNSYRFDAMITTDDYITLNNKLRMKNILDIKTHEIGDKLVEMMNAKLNIYTFYQYEGSNIPHKFDNMPELSNYTLTNKYTNREGIDYIKPINLMRSTITYEPNPTHPNGHDIVLSYIPLVDARSVNENDKFMYFLETLLLHHNHLMFVTDKVLNNHGIDMKFYNTYGRSRHFTVGEEDKVLDKVNCDIYFKICPNLNADESLIDGVKMFIKNYIETINDSGSNAIYISNLIQQLQNRFSDIRYLKFVNINKYLSNIQVIENKAKDVSTLSREEKLRYVPEYLTLRTKDIKIDIIKQ